MYKLAQLKEAEVRGVLAALVDNGIVPVEDQDQFEKVASETMDLVAGYDYDINDVAEASSYALQKVAEEEEAQLALGQLVLQKVAGEIDDDAFDYYAEAIVKEAADSDAVRKAQSEAAIEDAQSKAKSKGKYSTKAFTPEKLSRLQRAKNWVADAAKAGDIQRGWHGIGNQGKRAWGTIAKGVAKSGLVYGAPIGAIGSGAYYLANRKSK